MLVGAKRMDTKQDVEKQGKSEQKRRKTGSKEYSYNIEFMQS